MEDSSVSRDNDARKNIHGETTENKTIENGRLKRNGMRETLVTESIKQSDASTPQFKTNNNNKNNKLTTKNRPTILQPIKAFNPTFLQQTPPRLMIYPKTSYIIDTKKPTRTSSIKEENNRSSLNNKMGSGRTVPRENRALKLKRNKRFQSNSQKNHNTGDNTEKKENEPVKDKCKCVSCGMVFKYVCNLKSHFIAVHNMVRLEDEHMYLTNFLQSPKKGQPDTGTTCQSSFNQDSILDQTNLEILYGRQRPVYICKQCDKPFKFEINLETHLRCVHTEKKSSH